MAKKNNMENEKIKIGVKDIKKIQMSLGEKENILKNILSSSPAKPIRSPYTIYSIISILNKSKLAYYVYLFCLMIILGSGVVFASSDTLPGDVLYSLKVNVVEPIHSAFIFSSESKAEYQSGLAVERLNEAETLKDQGKLDSAKEKELNGLFSVHRTDLNKTLDKIKRKVSNGDNTATDNILINFESEIKTHAKVLDILTGSEDQKSQTENEKNSKNTQTGGQEIKGKFKNQDENTKEKTHQKENN
jgi:hypothetical protein